jgi:hypothetical protein
MSESKPTIDKNNLSEIHQSKSVDKNGYVGQKIDAKQAEEVSTYLKNEILKNSTSKHAAHTIS